MLNFLWVGLGGALGSICRFLISRHLPWDGISFPTATFVTNCIASLILGVLAGLLMSKFANLQSLKYFAVIGFCGGFSTFSTFAFEAFKLNQNGVNGIAILYALSSVIISVVLIFIGYYLITNLT